VFPWVEEDLQDLARRFKQLNAPPGGAACLRVYLGVSVVSVVLAVGLVSPARWQEGVLAGIFISLAINVVTRWSRTSNSGPGHPNRANRSQPPDE
jgi:hypothetical protein